MLIHILSHKIRLESAFGKTSEHLSLAKSSIPHTAPISPHEIRGSYRILSQAGQRDRNVSKCLTNPARKKRRTNKTDLSAIDNSGGTPSCKACEVVAAGAGEPGVCIAATNKPFGVEEQRTNKTLTDETAVSGLCNGMTFA